MRKLIEITQKNIIECDYCDYFVPNPTGDPNIDFDSYLNKPCPKCGHNLLTEKDLIDYRRIMRGIKFLNRYLSWLTIFHWKRSKTTDGEIHVHNGINIKI